jgi:hypothetical protein
MDPSIERDHSFQLERLLDNPTIDFHLRATEQKVEALLWLDGRRYRLLGVRDEEPASGQAAG